MTLHFYWTCLETQKRPSYWYARRFFVWCLQRHRNGGLNSGQKSAIIVTDAFLSFRFSKAWPHCKLCHLLADLCSLPIWLRSFGWPLTASLWDAGSGKTSVYSAILLQICVRCPFDYGVLDGRLLLLCEMLAQVRLLYTAPCCCRSVSVAHLTTEFWTNLTASLWDAGSGIVICP